MKLDISTGLLLPDAQDPPLRCPECGSTWVKLERDRGAHFERDVDGAAALVSTPAILKCWPDGHEWEHM